MQTHDFRDKKVLIIGLARSGISAARALCALGARVTVSDRKGADQLADALEQLTDLPVAYQLGGQPETAGFDLMVISPGVPIGAPFVRQAQGQGVEVIGEVELAYRLCPAPVCAITGTNGKTTTTALVGEIFKNADRVTHVVGNIGVPFISQVDQVAPGDVVVAEISSFQLESAVTFRPKVAAILNLTPDHLNRHGDMQGYAAVKMRIFERQGPEDTLVVNDDDPIVRRMALKAPGRVLRFSRTHAVDDGAYVQEGVVVFAWRGERTAVLKVDQIAIPGPHNLENALAATAMTMIMGVDAGIVADTLKNFQGIEHRMEFVREKDGVRYINDSKGTNPDSTIKAVQTMTAPTVLILGGSEKDSPFDTLAEEIARAPICQVVLVGQTAERIGRALEAAGYTHLNRAESFEAAVHTARDLAPKGGCVLLSPACASFDMFSDYEMRGRVFKQLVMQL